MNDRTTITRVADPASLADHAADRFIAVVGAALEQRGRATVALAGGSTPRAMNARLAAAPRRGAIDWSNVHFFFGDERCVPPDHPDSNYGMARQTLFEPLDIPDAHVTRMRGEDDPHVAALAYEGALADFLGADGAFDLIDLGMGPDGHTASLFPGTLATIDMSRSVVANFVPKFESYRITLTPRTLNAARHITISVGGAEKAESLAAVLYGPHDPERFPSQLIAPTTGDLTWIIDVAAAAQLHSNQ